MAKSKVVQHVNSITPAISISSGTLFEKLKQGECFLYNGSLYMRESGSEQIAINLATGGYVENLCGTEVTPVTIAITWKKK